MWEYSQNIDLETSVKISQYCYSWQSVCWFALKGLELWKILVWDRSPTYLVVLTFLLIALFWLIFKRLKRKWNDVPMSEIRSLRDRVQFVTQDMAMLQDALNATTITKPLPVFPDRIGNANDEKLIEYTEIEEPFPVQDKSLPEPVIPDPEPEEDFVVKPMVRFDANIQGKLTPAVSKVFKKPKSTKMVYAKKLDVGKRNVHKRPSASVAKIEWKI
ncbi:uncharacterized protein LOC6545703 [Drosophila erecta]|uniref:Uncharacterized protein n=1 Tax=Drosophila erecta TaxID=7220 RepID=B3ND20_DROER|nr:uncharacterized protein LOC6545703 [Drosophila erecta]EDV51742.1 uncharacterized protein Dere_GG15677 [Drosophila erecta]